MGACSQCGGLILRPDTSYGINPTAVCHCEYPKPFSDSQAEVIGLPKYDPDMTTAVTSNATNDLLNKLDKKLPKDLSV